MVFSANLGPDTTPPTVTSTAPANGATGVSASANLIATFSEAMDAASISGSSFELRDAANGLVAANVAYNASTRIATLSPVNALAASTTYTATIKGGVSGAKDSAGNPLANDVSWSFTTAAAAATGTVTIWPATATPAVLSDSDTGAVELGVKFRSDVDGLITGIRFYKGPANTGSHVGNLWNANGTLLTTDAHHITAPSEGGIGAARAIQRAMADAGITPAEVDYINAHGTATPLNDKFETMSIKRALGEEHAYRVAVSSTKSMTGHIMGATGALETIFCLLAIRDQIVPPTINYVTPDPECDLDVVPNTARSLKVQVVINNAFGFGGHNAVLVIKQFQP